MGYAAGMREFLRARVYGNKVRARRCLNEISWFQSEA